MSDAEARLSRVGRPQRRHFIIALLVDLPVVLLLLASWFTVLLLPIHVSVGSAFAVVALAHLCTRLPIFQALVRSARGEAPSRRVRRRFVGDLVSMTALAGVTASGFIEWAYLESGPATAFHSFASAAVIFTVARHIWLRRTALRERLTGNRRTRAEPASGRLEGGSGRQPG